MELDLSKIAKEMRSVAGANLDLFQAAMEYCDERDRGCLHVYDILNLRVWRIIPQRLEDSTIRNVDADEMYDSVLQHENPEDGLENAVWDGSALIATGDLPPMVWMLLKSVNVKPVRVFIDYPDGVEEVEGDPIEYVTNMMRRGISFAMKQQAVNNNGEEVAGYVLDW